VIQPFLGRKGAATAFGQISSVRPDRHSAQVQTGEKNPPQNPQGRRAANLGRCDLRGIRSSSQGVALVAGVSFRDTNRDGSRRWAIKWEPLGANDPGSPVRWPRRAEVVGFLAVGITGW